MKKSLLGLNVVLVAMSFHLAGCDVLMSQNPADSFISKKFPKQLEWFRSQLREIPSAKQAEIVRRVQRDQQRNDLLKVAVIDSGVDIAHADLLNQIAYRVENDRIVGAGHDIMGNGAFGSHVLINPSLFAFGASGLRGGRIENPPESPLKELQVINDRFRALVLEGIQNDPKLRESLYGRLEASGFTVFGFEDIRLESEQMLKAFKKYKEMKMLVNVDTKAKDWDKSQIEDMKNGWSIMNERQTPVAFDPRLEHTDRFVGLVQSAYATIDAELGFTKKLLIYNQFVNHITATKEVIDPKKVKSRDTLLKAMEFVLYGSDIYDPIISFKRKFQSHPDYRKLSFEEAMLKYYADQVNLIEEVLKNPKTTKETRKTIEKNKSGLEQLKNSIDNLIALEKNPTAYEAMRSDLHRYVYHTQHPYLAKESNGNSHGTHVSGVIAKQNPKVRIVPIRVTTQSVKVSEARQKEVVAEMMGKFQEFMNSPYFEPLKAEISAEYGNFKMSQGSVENQVKKYLVENPLNAVFILDILSAVEQAGLEKAKLANVSLGTTFKKNHSLSQKAASMAEDLFSEFARYKIGESIKTKAPGTLFMIATGNDGGWIDGVSKTGFPVGITSLRMIKIAKEKKLTPTPNNSSKNVLAVASINPNGTLTPFTNILIDPNIPQIFSTGEEIKSSVPPKDLKRSTQIVTKSLGKAFNVAMTSIATASTFEMESSDGPDLKRLSLLNEISMQFQTSLPTLIHIADPIGRQSMSGTSMATPTVTGLVADYVIDKAERLNVTADKLYEDKRFSPETLSTEILELAREKTLTPMFSLRMLVEGIKTYKTSQADRRQVEAMKGIVAPLAARPASAMCLGLFK